MGKIKVYQIIKEILSVIIICILGFLALTFTVLYFETFNGGLLYEYSGVLVKVSTAVVCVMTSLCLLYLRKSEKLLYKLTLVSVAVIFAVTVALYLLKRGGVLNKISDVNDVRDYIASFGSLAEVLFVVLQILQVTVLPIPSILTVTAGVFLFGPVKGALLSSVGIVTGSLIAFFVGRIFGVKAIKWLIGESNLNKGLKLIEGKDKVIFSLTFLLPFFPDDLLCFVAGITTIKVKDFIFIVIITRFISVLTTSLSVGNMLIPYDTWWGICIWIAVFAIFILVVYKTLFSKKQIG